MIAQNSEEILYIIYRYEICIIIIAMNFKSSKDFFLWHETKISLLIMCWYWELGYNVNNGIERDIYCFDAFWCGTQLSDFLLPLKGSTLSCSRSWTFIHFIWFFRFFVCYCHCYSFSQLLLNIFGFVYANVRYFPFFFFSKVVLSFLTQASSFLYIKTLLLCFYEI